MRRCEKTRGVGKVTKCDAVVVQTRSNVGPSTAETDDGFLNSFGGSHRLFLS